jgi:hypothetical protein
MFAEWNYLLKLCVDVTMFSTILEEKVAFIRINQGLEGCYCTYQELHTVAHIGDTCYAYLPPSTAAYVFFLMVFMLSADYSARAV